MGTIPTTPTFTAGEKLTAAKLEQVCDAIDFWALPPRCYAYLAGSSSPADSTWTVMPLDGEQYDVVQTGDAASHDLVTNNSRIYIRTTAKYEIGGQAQFTSNATGARQAQVRLNAAGAVGSGSELIRSTQGAVSGVSTSVVLPTIELPLTAGDYLELFVHQSSGGALAMAAGASLTFLRIKLSAS